jgi:hypothetical protein
MIPLELIALNLGLEYQLTAEGLLVPFPNSTEQARCIVYRHREGYALYLRHDLPPKMLEGLRALSHDSIFHERQRVRRLLGPCTQMWIGQSYYAVRDPSAEEHRDVEALGNNWVIKVNAVVASVAWSVRGDERAEEVAVETGEPFRRRGFARQVVSAWTQAVLRRERVAFYSHHHDNLASEALAHSLGLAPYAEGVAHE